MLALTFHFSLQSFSLYISLLVVTGFYTTVCQHIGWWGIFCNEAESISPLYYSRDGYYSSYFPGFSLSNIARFRFLVSKRCCIAHFPLPRALLSSRRSMLPVHANVAPILPLSDVSQVAVNRPQATSHKGMGIPQSGKPGILGFGIQNQRLSLIPLHGAIQWKNQANQTV